MSYDVTIIGGGPGGYVAAIKAAQLGMKTCLIEKGSLGGTCLNVGCIPTKVLLRSIEALNEVKAAASFGVKLKHAEEAELDLSVVQNRKNEIVKQLVYGVGALLKKNGVTVIKGEASFAGAHTVMVGGERIESGNIIIATGSSAKGLPCETDGSIPVYNSTDLLDMKILPKSMVIVGAGVIGMEFAYFLRNSGVEVTVLEFLDGILPMTDGEIASIVRAEYEEAGVEFHTGARVVKIENGSVIFEKGGKLLAKACDSVLASVGRSPNVAGLNLEEIGIKMNKGAIDTNPDMQTNIPGIYAIGDVNGVSMLAHTASMEGITAVDNIAGHPERMKYSTIPSVIYIQPEVASIGLTEEQAKQKYGDIVIGRFSMTGNGKASVQGERQGMIKIIAEARYKQIVGAHLHCVHASELIAEMSVAMGMECTADELVKIIHPHPSISEAVFEACLAATGRAIHC